MFLVSAHPWRCWPFYPILDIFLLNYILVVNYFINFNGLETFSPFYKSKPGLRGGCSANTQQHGQQQQREAAAGAAAAVSGAGFDGPVLIKLFSEALVSVVHLLCWGTHIVTELLHQTS